MFPRNHTGNGSNMNVLIKKNKWGKGEIVNNLMQIIIEFITYNDVMGNSVAFYRSKVI